MREGRDGFQGPEWRVPTRRRLPGDIPAIPTHPWGNELGQTSLRNPISHPPPTISIFPLKYFNCVRSCRTATAQTDTKRVRCPLDTEEVRAGPSLCLVVLHPKLPRSNCVCLRWWRDVVLCLHRQDFSVRRLYELPAGKLWQCLSVNRPIYFCMML